MKTTKRRYKMVGVNLINGRTGKVFDTVEMPKSYMDRLARIARLRGITLDKVFCEALGEMMADRKALIAA